MISTSLLLAISTATWCILIVVVFQGKERDSEWLDQVSESFLAEIESAQKVVFTPHEFKSPTST